MWGGRLQLANYGAYSSGGEPGVDSENGVVAGQSTVARSRDLSNLAQLSWENAHPVSVFEDIELRLYHRHESSNFSDPLKSTPGPSSFDTRLGTPGVLVNLGGGGKPFDIDARFEGRVEAAHDILRATNQSGRDRPRVGGAFRGTVDVLSDLLKLSGGFRLDWTDGFDLEVLPSFGIVLEPRDWIRFRAHVGRAYRAPNFDELFHPDEGFIRGNPDLEPEDAWNFDAGGEVALEKAGPFSNLTLRASWFRREIDESIVFVLINAETVEPNNTGKATSDGYEISASVDWTRYARLIANYTETDSRRDLNGSRLPGQANREAFVKLRIGPEDHWKLIAEFQHVGEILVGESDRRFLPERDVWNAGASLNLAEVSVLGLDRWVDDLWIFVRGDNLGDVAVRDVLSFPQPGRRLSSGFEAQF